MKSRGILFCLEGFFPHQKAGTEIYVLNLAKYLIAQGKNVQVLISTSQHLLDYQYEGISVYTFNIPEKPVAAELNGLIPPRGLEGFLEKVKQIDPVIVHFHSIGRAINSFHITEVKRLGLKTVYTAHLGNTICIKGDFLKFNKEVCKGEVIPKSCLACRLNSHGVGERIAMLSSELIHVGIAISAKLLPPSLLQARHRKQEIEQIKNNADAIIAISPWIMKVFQVNDIHQNLHLVEQGVDKFFVDKKRIEEFNRLSSGKSIRMGFVGRMHPIKGFHFLKDALQLIESSAWQMVVATIPPKDDKDYYQEMLRWASSHKQIEWRENLSREDVIKLLDTLDLLILPSISETAPLIILEAFARRVPVLGSSNYGTSDMIKDRVNGSVFKNGSADDLKKKLVEIIADPTLLEKWSSNISVPRTFDNVGEDMLNIYEKIYIENFSQ